MTYKKLLKNYFTIIIAIFLFIVSAIFIYDPLQIYHKLWITKESRIHGNMRLQAAGIINNYNFDSIILGTSMLKGSSAKEASVKLNGEFVNISADGSDLYERSIILNYALNKKNIKQVIFSLDTGLDLNLRVKNNKFPLDRFDFLYDNNPLNDLKVYWNKKYINCLLTFSTSSKCIGNKRNLIRPPEWFDSIYEKNKKISGIEGWISEKGRGRNVLTRINKHLKNPLQDGKEYEKKLAKTYQIIDETLIPIVNKNKKVSFHIVFPPYSRFLFALWKQKNYQKYKLYIKTIEYLVINSIKYDNMKIYVLDNIKYINNINNYRDMRHYNLEMNRLILDYIKDKKNIKNINELNKIIQEIEVFNSNYDLSKYIAKLKNAYKFRVKYDKKIKNNILTLEGWVFSYKVDRVELYEGNQIIATSKLYKNQENYKMFPQYKQLNNAFYFNNIILNNKYKKLKLVFKFKNKTIKHITIKK